MSDELLRIKQEVLDCKKCPLYKTRKNPVFGEGSLKAMIMFIGEAPGYNEDLLGRPFVGRAGKFLDELLDSINLSRNEIFITNILKCRPPNNRDPLESEIKACSPYLNEQINIIKPRIIVTLGNFSTRFILKKFSISPQQITKIHGKVFRIKNLIYDVVVIPMFHPAAALYNPNMKQTMFDDFEILREELNKIKEK